MFAKYVVLKVGAEERPLILPPEVAHTSALFMFGTHSSAMVSAGYLEMTVEGSQVKCECYGHSDNETGPKVYSRKEVDDALLAQVFKQRTSYH